MPTPTKQDRTDARQARVAELLGERPHAENCPGENDQTVLEGFDAQRPEDRARGIAAGPVLVLRCRACGGQRVRQDLTTGDLPR